VTQIVNALRRKVAVEEDQYEIGGTAYWSDEQLQAVLDKHVSQRLVQAPVVKRFTRGATGMLEVREAQAEVRGTLDAEAASVIDSGGVAVPGATVHPDGHITFDTDRSTYALLLTGLAYDLNVAAAEVLTDWAAAVKAGYDITVDGQSLKRSQRHAQLLEQAREFGRKALAGSVSLRRTDGRRRASRRGAWSWWR